jgi:hypothetical protein
MLLGMKYALVVPFYHKTAAWPSLSQQKPMVGDVCQN